MNDLTTILRQRILIVYSDIEWRDEMFSKVLDIYPHDMINKMIKSRCGCWIELVDGTMVRFVYANDSARGIKANKLIIQPGISKTFSDTVLKHLLIRIPEIYVATDEGIKPAAIYYTEEAMNAK
jgi:hypothetical protein